MCSSCWEDEGSPSQWNDSIARAVELIKDLYTEEPTGGPLHCTLDDWNVDTGGKPITPTYAMADNPGFPGSGFPDRYSGHVHTVCDELAALLTSMSVSDRYAALAHAEGLTK